MWVRVAGLSLIVICGSIDQTRCPGRRIQMPSPQRSISDWSFADPRQSRLLISLPVSIAP